MASSFYQKMVALHEEFQKREMEYLKAEEDARSNIQRKSIQSLENNLLKVRQSEKENEELYRNLMVEVDNLNRRTELISLKLDKLNILKDTVASSTVPDFPVHSLSLLGGDTFHRDFQFSTPISVIETTPELHFSSSKQNLQSFSTQTDDLIFCENCSFPVSMQLKEMDETTTRNIIHMDAFQTIPSNAYAQRDMQVSITNKDVPIYDNNALNKNASLSSDGLAKYTSHYDASSAIANTSHFENTSIIVPSADETFTSERNVSLSMKDKTEPLPVTYDENVGCQDDIPSAKLIEKLHVGNGEMRNVADGVVAKSDNESMNHEFDFLESDKRDFSEEQISQKRDFSKSADDNNHSHVIPPVTESKSLKSNTNSQEGAIERSHQIDRTNEVLDAKSDSSMSAGPQSPSVHSGSASAASDSDSFYRKETPITATAAYRALLGNTLATEKSQNPISYSDTEDEVETAFASAVRKPSTVLLKTSQAQKGEAKKDIPPETESKSATKPSKPATINKPQSKLSKTTRKVLGLETSSESEIELAVKPSTKAQNVDDDDFFDF